MLLVKYLNMTQKKLPTFLSQKKIYQKYDFSVLKVSCDPEHIITYLNIYTQILKIRNPYLYWSSSKFSFKKVQMILRTIHKDHAHKTMFTWEANLLNLIFFLCISKWWRLPNAHIQRSKTLLTWPNSSDSPSVTNMGFTFFEFYWQK